MPVLRVQRKQWKEVFLWEDDRIVDVLHSCNYWNAALGACVLHF